MTPVPKICHWCHGTIDTVSVTLSELEDDLPAVNDWRLCSWSCAEGLVRRMAMGRDDPGPRLRDVSERRA